MPGISIADTTPDGKHLAFDLKDVLEVLCHRLNGGSWRISGVEALGEGANELHVLSDAHARVDTERLRALSARISQTIDGEFEWTPDDQSDPAVLVRAVDSTTFDVHADRAETLEALRQSFQDVSDL